MHDAEERHAMPVISSEVLPATRGMVATFHADPFQCSATIPSAFVADPATQQSAAVRHDTSPQSPFGGPGGTGALAPSVQAAPAEETATSAHAIATSTPI